MDIQISYEDLVKATDFLSQEQQEKVISRLQSHARGGKYLMHKTREQHIAEHEALKAAGAFPAESLWGVAQTSDEIQRMSADELDEYLREIGREWEKEWDDDPDND